MIKLGNIQYLPEWRIILGGKYAVWDIALKWKAVWTEKSGSNKTHKDFWNFDLNHKNSVVQLSERSNTVNQVFTSLPWLL